MIKMRNRKELFPPMPLVLMSILLLILAGLLGACGNSNAGNKNFTIGIVNLTDALAPVIDGFKAGMVENGYTETENVTYIYDGPVNNIGDLDAAVQRLVDSHVDMILSLSTPATLAAKRVTADTDIPVVFGTVTNPVATGIVDHLAQHKGNVTGIKTGGSEGKDLEWLQTAVPELRRVFIPYNPNDASSSSALDDVRQAAEALDVEVVAVETPNRDAVLAALQDTPEDIDGILLLPDSIVVAQIADIVSFTLERKIPLAGVNKDHVEAGAFMAFGFDHFEVGRQASRLAQKVLEGSSVTALPIETAEFYLSINLQTALTLNITVPDDLLRSAETIVR